MGPQPRVSGWELGGFRMRDQGWKGGNRRRRPARRIILGPPWGHSWVHDPEIIDGETICLANSAKNGEVL